MSSLEEKAELLALLSEATNDGVVDWDVVSNETKYNERWRFLLGWDVDDFAPSPSVWRELIHPDERAGVEKALSDHLTEDWPFVQMVRMHHRSNGWRWILIRGASRRSSLGCPERMVIIFADIDERVRAETQVRALVEAIPDALVRVRTDGTILAVKEGSPNDRSPGPPESARELFAALQRSDSSEEFVRSIATAASRNEVVEISCGIHTPPAEARNYEVRIVGSGPDEAVCILRDVTRQKRIEEQLERGHKLDAIGQLAAGLAHEINTPLQYMGDNIQFAQDAIPPLLALLDAYRSALHSGGAPSSATAASIELKEAELDLPFVNQALPNAVQTVQDGLERISKIVRAMKAFEDVGRQGRAPVDLNSIVENATVVATNAWRRSSDLSLVLAPNLPLVPCIAGEIAQVILNLVTNAAQAVADKNGVTGAKGHIVVETVRSGADFVEIRVTDDGVGIPAAVRPRVFDPFFTTRPVGQGTGQGLAQVHSAVVRLHRGSVHFDTREGSGTTFVVRLPLGEQKAAPVSG